MHYATQGHALQKIPYLLYHSAFAQQTISEYIYSSTSIYLAPKSCEFHSIFLFRYFDYIFILDNSVFSIA